MLMMSWFISWQLFISFTGTEIIWLKVQTSYGSYACTLSQFIQVLVKSIRKLLTDKMFIIISKTICQLTTFWYIWQKPGWIGSKLGRPSITGFLITNRLLTPNKGWFQFIMLKLTQIKLHDKFIALFNSSWLIICYSVPILSAPYTPLHTLSSFLSWIVSSSPQLCYFYDLRPLLFRSFLSSPTSSSASFLLLFSLLNLPLFPISVNHSKKKKKKTLIHFIFFSVGVCCSVKSELSIPRLLLFLLRFESITPPKRIRFWDSPRGSQQVSFSNY